MNDDSRKSGKISNTRDFIEKTAVKIIDTVTSIPRLSSVNARKDWLAPPPLSEFQHLEPWGWGLDDDKWIFSPRDCTPQVLWPIDTGVICDRAGDDETLSIMRARSVTPRDVRGYASRFSPYMVRVDFAKNDRGKLITAAGLDAWVNNTWVDAQRRIDWNQAGIPNRVGDIIYKDSKHDSIQPSLMIAVALKHRYEWAVSVGLEDSPSVRFETDPTGIKDIFRIRDLPPGADRREALMTWVSAHWRQDRRDEEVEIYVRKHLRGAVSFSWRGMCANVLPSQYDIEQRDKLKEERRRMHAEGTDRKLKNETR